MMIDALMINDFRVSGGKQTRISRTELRRWRQSARHRVCNKVRNIYVYIYNNINIIIYNIFTAYTNTKVEYKRRK